MEGFFTAKEGQSKFRPDGKKLSCVVCGLYKKVETPRLPPVGNFKKGILNVGQSPTEIDDRKGSHWQGKSGRFLKHAYASLGIDLFEDCLNVNACHCRTVDGEGDDRPPTNNEVECCRRTTLNIIETYKPKVVILLGDSALYSVIGGKWKKELGVLHKWRGWNIPDLELHTWVCPTYHPDFIQASMDKRFPGAEETIWLQDLEKAFSLLSIPFYEYKEPRIEVITDLSVLYNITGEVAIDYETTGLKPHGLEHRIVCVSVATSEDHAYVFMMPSSRKDRQPFIDLLANPNIGKIAQNMKFEETWSYIILKQSVVNWRWDTMLSTHEDDNRPDITGLKFQSYINFGIADYDSEVTPYLKPKVKGEGSNSVNQIDLLLKKPGGQAMLLRYCGFDAVYGYRLAVKQRLNYAPF